MVDLDAIFGPDGVVEDVVPVIIEAPVEAAPRVKTPPPPPIARSADGTYPIVEGEHHWNPYITEAEIEAGSWGEEFRQGYHRDPRQPSKLQPQTKRLP